MKNVGIGSKSPALCPLERNQCLILSNHVVNWQLHILSHLLYFREHTLVTVGAFLFAVCAVAAVFLSLSSRKLLVIAIAVIAVVVLEVVFVRTTVEGAIMHEVVKLGLGIVKLSP